MGLYIVLERYLTAFREWIVNSAGNMLPEAAIATWTQSICLLTQSTYEVTWLVMEPLVAGMLAPGFIARCLLPINQMCTYLYRFQIMTP